MDENNENRKITVAHDKDGNIIYPITRANAVILNNEENSSLESVLEQNKKAIDDMQTNFVGMEGVKEIKETLDEHKLAGQELDELVYAEDEREGIENILEKYIILDDIDLSQLDENDVINYGEKLAKLIRYIKDIQRESVKHDIIEDGLEDRYTARVNLNTVKQEISNLKAEIVKMKSEIITMNNKVTDFLGTDIYNSIEQNLLDSVETKYLNPMMQNYILKNQSEIASLQYRVGALETAADCLEQDVLNIYRILGIKDISELPESRTVSDILDAVYAISKDFIEWKENENESGE